MIPPSSGDLGYPTPPQSVCRKMCANLELCSLAPLVLEPPHRGALKTSV